MVLIRNPQTRNPQSGRGKADFAIVPQERSDWLGIRRRKVNLFANKEKKRGIMDNRDLFRMAKDVLPHAYAPFSKFHVGAALLTKTGEVFTGVNVENSSFGGTICAERTACVKAVSEGFRDFDAIAVVGSSGTASPCGICRQFLYEFAPNLRVIVGEDEEHLTEYTLKELLPEGFRL